VREPQHLKWIPCRHRPAPAIRQLPAPPEPRRVIASSERAVPWLPHPDAGTSRVLISSLHPTRSPSNGHPWRRKPPDLQTVGLGRQPNGRPCSIIGLASYRLDECRSRRTQLSLADTG
jgi:hypothetical protein